MTLNNSLNEKAQEVPLLIWNDAQKNLWNNLVSINIVDKNDINLFIKFAKFFDNFYMAKHKFPNIKDVMKIL